MHAASTRSRLARLGGAAALAIALSLVTASPALADDDDRGRRVVVSPDDMRGWFFHDDGKPVGSGRLEPGPGNAPAGKGSAELTVNSTGREILAKAAYQGVFLRDLTRLEYWTHRTYPAAGIVQISLQFNIDRDLTDSVETWQGRLVFEPYFTHPAEAARAGVWLRWDTQDNAPLGSWWFTGAPQSAPVTGCAQADPCTWSEVLAKFPNVGVHRTFGAVLLKAGGPVPGGFVGNTDALTIGCRGRTILWDFEPSKSDHDKDKKAKKNDLKLCGENDDEEDDD